MPRTALMDALKEPVSTLRSADGTPVPLEKVTAHGRLEGLLFELTVEQRYVNRSDENIEAVFTFPLPLRAVLLGLELELGERRLKAQAVARRVASERYEQALEQGDTAALLEHNGQGLYTVSLGNLQAGETAVIRYRYAEALDAHRGSVRVNVPTVVAPRYGDPRRAGLEGPTVPGVELLAEYPFEIRILLAGLSDAGTVRSPSHAIRTEQGEDGLTVVLDRGGFLDRDFVIEIDRAAIASEALVARDGEGFVALVSPTLELDRHEHVPVNAKILLDCSGSMGGDSIQFAKRALLEVLDRLDERDRVSLTRFGSTFEHVTDGLEPADAHTLKPLKALVKGIDANLGGTEMGAALQSVLAISSPRDATCDVVLITDGEIYDVQGVVDLVANRRHRLFAIAIGAAPNEALARSLAKKTGGACEFVGRGEDAKAAIVRTFSRLRAQPRRLGPVQWPSATQWTTCAGGAVFPGDTLHVFAGFVSEPRGNVTVAIEDGAEQGTSLQLPVAPRLTDGDLLPRLAAARRIAALAENAEAARDLAVQYQLASAHTSFVVVAERADGQKATELPTTVAVPHMLAAAWGGTALSMPEACHAPAMPVACRRPARDASMHVDDGELDIPAFLRSDAPSPERRLSASGLFSKFRLGGSPSSPAPARSPGGPKAPARSRAPAKPMARYRPAQIVFTPDERRALLASLRDAYQAREPMPRSLRAFCARHPVPAVVRDALVQLLASSGCDEHDLIEVFVALLAANNKEAEFAQTFLESLKGATMGERRFRDMRRDMSKAVFA